MLTHSLHNLQTLGKSDNNPTRWSDTSQLNSHPLKSVEWKTLWRGHEIIGESSEI